MSNRIDNTSKNLAVHLKTSEKVDNTKDNTKNKKSENKKGKFSLKKSISKLISKNRATINKVDKKLKSSIHNNTIHNNTMNDKEITSTFSHYKTESIGKSIEEKVNNNNNERKQIEEHKITEIRQLAVEKNALKPALGAGYVLTNIQSIDHNSSTVQKHHTLIKCLEECNIKPLKRKLNNKEYIFILKKDREKLLKYIEKTLLSGGKFDGGKEKLCRSYVFLINLLHQQQKSTTNPNGICKTVGISSYQDLNELISNIAKKLNIKLEINKEKGNMTLELDKEQDKKFTEILQSEIRETYRNLLVLTEISNTNTNKV